MPVESPEFVDQLIEAGLPHLPEKERPFAMDGYRWEFFPKSRLLDRAYFDEMFPIYIWWVYMRQNMKVL